MRRLALGVTIVAALTLHASADSPQADALVGEASELIKAGDFVGAATKFKAAYAVDPRPDLMCNIGVAYYKAKQLPHAQLYLGRCLERGTALDAAFVESVRNVLKAVEGALQAADFTPVDIAVEPAGASVSVSSFGADDSFIGSRVVFVPFGAQTVTARAEGYSDKTVNVDARSRTLVSARVVLDRKPTETGTGTGTGTSTGTGTGTGATGAVSTGTTGTGLPSSVEQSPPSKLPAIAVSAVSVVSFAVAIVAFGKAHDASDHARFAITDGAYAEDVDTMNSWNTWVGVGVGVGAATAVVAGYLWWRALRSTHVEVSPQSGGIAFSVSGGW